MTNKVYDNFKIFVTIIYPALTAFVGATLEALNVQCNGVVVTIMTAFGVFLGSMLKALSTKYHKNLNIEEGDDNNE